jgi:hypothetical protein
MFWRGGLLMTVKLEKRQQQIDIREAHNVWDVLNSKYMAVERLLTWHNLAHDMDLKAVINQTVKTLNENIKILEKIAEKHAVKTPDRNRSYVNFAGAMQVTTDEFIALDLFLYYQGHVENMSKVMRSTVTNDKVRETFKKITLKTVDEMDSLINYLTLKGWVSTPPMYKHLPTNVDQGLGLPEAANLWDHLTFRYDNIRTTEHFVSTAHDVDFKSILKIGLNTLQKQAEKLEKELQYYAIPLPKRPAKVTISLTNTEVLEDDYMYRILINALQGASIMHAQSYKECVICDKVRNLFKQFLKDELDIIDNFLKFGKAKGWLNPVPTYGP